MDVFEGARRLEDQAAAGAWLGDTFGAWADGLPDDETDALHRYKGDDYRPLNAALRRGGALGDKQVRLVALIDRALERLTLPEPVIVYRGFHLVGRAIAGAQLQDRAYASTSLLRTHAKGFLSLPAEQPFTPALAQILLPAGTRCGAPDLIEYMGEAEILLRRATTFTIHAAAAPSKDTPYWGLDLEAST
jgi:hypothetical protein